MADRDLKIAEKVEFNGVFSFEDAYSVAFNWFKDSGFGLVEKKYSEKVTSNGKDVQFEWSASKKLSDYFKEEVDVKAKAEGLNDVELEIDGRKKRAHKGKIEFAIKGTLVKDPDSKWDESPWYKFLRDLYNKYIIPSRVNAVEEKVMDDVRDFKEKMKEFFEISGKR